MARWEEGAAAPVRVDLLVERLTDHLLGHAELSATQIRAAEILLRRAAQEGAPSGAIRVQPITEARNVIVRVGD
jgi:hypothetical protein